MNEATIPEQQDALVVLFNDVRQQRERIGKIADPTPKKALTELSDTGLSVMEDLVGYLLSFRQYVSESLQDVDERLSDLEVEAPSGLSDDEATMILGLASMCEAFVRIVADTSTSVSPEARAKFDEALALVAQVREWVPTRLADGFDDDEDDEEPIVEAIGKALWKTRSSLRKSSPTGSAGHLPLRRTSTMTSAPRPR